MNTNDFDNYYFFARKQTEAKRKKMHDRDRKWILQNLTESNFSYGSAILDIGCSDGNLLKPLKRMGYEIYGIEPNLDQANSAAQSGIKIVEKPSDVPNLGAVVIRGTLHHIPDADKLLRSIIAAFRKPTVVSGNWLFILAEPNADSKIFKRFHRLPALEESPDFSSNYKVHSATFLKSYLEISGAKVSLIYPYIKTPYSCFPLDILKYSWMLLTGRYIRVPWFGNMFNLSAHFHSPNFFTSE